MLVELDVKVEVEDDDDDDEDDDIKIKVERRCMETCSFELLNAVVMEVKEDFYMYRSGVYHHSLPADYLPPSQRQTNFHSVRLIGSVHCHNYHRLLLGSV